MGDRKLVQGIVQDLTEHKQAEAILQHRAQVDSLLSSISRQFIDRDADTAINFALRQVGEFTNSDRSYVFRFHTNRTKLKNTHEWCADGIEPFINEPHECCTADSWSCQILLSGGVLDVPDVNHLPPEAAQDQADWKHQSIVSLLIVPMIHLGNVVGCVGLDAVRRERIWSEETIRLLKLIGEIIALGQARHAAISKSAVYLRGAGCTRKDAEEKVAKAFRSSPHPITIATLSDNRFIDVNPSFLRMSGYALEEVVGHTAAELNLEIVQEAYAQAVQLLLETGSLHNQECEFRTKSGESKTVLLSVETIHLAGVECTLNIINDITERKRLENEFTAICKCVRYIFSFCLFPFALKPGSYVPHSNENCCRHV